MIVFAHDHHFYKVDENIYSSGGLPASVWNRYLSVFGQVHVVGRDGGELNEVNLNKYVMSSCVDVDFTLLPNLSNFGSLIWKSASIKQQIESIIIRSEGVIARLPSEYGYLAIKLAQKHEIPWAIEVVECPWDALWNYGSFKAKVFAPIQWYRLRKIASRSLYTLYVTREFLQRRYPSKGVSVSCSNVEISSVSIDAAQTRSDRFFDQHSKINIGLIGSLKGGAKGIDTALHAFQDLNKKHKNVELRILGSGPVDYWKDFAQNLGIGERVRFEGTLPAGEAVFRWLDQIDIYIQPSRKEGLPRALIEAMSRGCPAIGTKVAGIPELLDKSCLVSAANSGQLSKKLDDFLTNPVLLDSQIKRNLKVAESYQKEFLDSKRTLFWKKFYSSFT